MKKLISLVALFCLLSVPVQAKPWYKDWKVWLVIGAAAGSSIALSKTTHDCRARLEPGTCFGEYSEPAVIRGLNIAGTAGMTAISLWGRHEHIKEWAVPALGMATFNGIESYKQASATCPAGQNPVMGMCR
jgi:hypothetical protein